MPSLRNHFIIAMPSLADPYFSRTVTYICEHNKEGAMGIIINQPTDMKIDALLKKINVDVTPHFNSDKPVYVGGPVCNDQGFVLHKEEPESKWSSSISISDQVHLTTSKDILQAIGTDLGPQDFLISLGYAGWSGGQLEQELKDNAWLTIEADLNIMFNTPIHLRWERATEKLGFNPWQLSADVGHA